MLHGARPPAKRCQVDQRESRDPPRPLAEQCGNRAERNEDERGNELDGDKKRAHRPSIAVTPILLDAPASGVLGRSGANLEPVVRDQPALVDSGVWTWVRDRRFPGLAAWFNTQVALLAADRTHRSLPPADLLIAAACRGGWAYLCSTTTAATNTSGA